MDFAVIFGIGVTLAIIVRLDYLYVMFSFLLLIF